MFYGLMVYENWSNGALKNVKKNESLVSLGSIHLSQLVFSKLHSIHISPICPFPSLPSISNFITPLSTVRPHSANHRRRLFGSKRRRHIRLRTRRLPKGRRLRILAATGRPLPRRRRQRLGHPGSAGTRVAEETRSRARSSAAHGPRSHRRGRGGINGDAKC